MFNLRELLSKYGIVIVLLGLFVFFSLASEYFLTQNNLTNVLRQIAVLGIVSVGMTMVILTGGIDLSVGSTVAFVSIITAVAMKTWGLDMVSAVALGIAVGGVVGLINGVAITLFEIPALIVTLGMLTAVRGVTYLVSGGLPIFGFPEGFTFLGRGMLGVVPIPVLIMFVILILGWVVLNRTEYGRYLYAIGGNREAARLSGIAVTKVLIGTYVIAGIFTGISGVIMVSRLNSAQPNMATGFEMDVITAVVLGGISIMGGEGRFMGVVYGVFIIGILSNGLILLNVQEYWQLVIKGTVLLVAVGLDQYNIRLSHKAAQKTQSAAMLQDRSNTIPSSVNG